MHTVAADHVFTDVGAEHVFHLDILVAQRRVTWCERQVQCQRDRAVKAEVQRIDAEPAGKELGHSRIAEEGVVAAIRRRRARSDARSCGDALRG